MICDTSGLIAALGFDQPFGEECVAAMRKADELVISPMVLAELGQIIGRRAGPRAAIVTMRELSSGNYDIATFGHDALSVASHVMEAHRDMSLGLTDASLVVLAKRHNTNEILTLDQRLRAIRGLDGRNFKLLPFDMD